MFRLRRPKGARIAAPFFQSTFVPTTSIWKRTHKVTIELKHLDRYGLIPADLTGFKIVQWDMLGNKIGKLERKHGDDLFGAGTFTLGTASLAGR